MDIPNPLPQVSYALQKSLGLWLSVWAIRVGTGIDYKLGARSRVIRWAVVVVCFALTSIPGTTLGSFRVFFYLVGLSFLCWPNLAYHFGKLFDDWPIAEGRVESFQEQSASRWIVSYDFEVGGERYGGSDTVRAHNGGSGSVPCKGTKVLIRFDPLNPDRCSRIQKRATN